MTEKEQIKALLLEYLRDDLQADDHAVLEAWAARHPAYRELLDRYRSGRFTEDLRDLHQSGGKIEETFDYVMSHRAALGSKSRPLRRWLPYAAAVALVASVVGWWIIGYRDSVTGLAAEEILPGGNKARLTLADGRSIALSSEHTGIVVNDKEISYDDGTSPVDDLRVPNEASENPDGASVDVLSLTTPDGGTYRITLPDGSKVWLNSASTLRYPRRFNDEARVVEIVGEGYFEIAKDSKRPFSVRSDNQVVDVLGTAFNISAYPDGPETKTTLVTGRVRVGRSLAGGGMGMSLELSPGQQGIARGMDIQVTTVDLDSHIAWKQGYFSFAEDLQGVMKQLARWYVVEVEFRDETLKKLFVFGRGERSRPLSDVLRLLEEATEARFVVEEGKRGERRVVVMR